MLPGIPKWESEDQEPPGCPVEFDNEASEPLIETHSSPTCKEIAGESDLSVIINGFFRFKKLGK